MNRTSTVAAVVCSLALLFLPLLARPTWGQFQTTSSSFHGEATYSQRERVAFQSRGLAEVHDMSRATTAYDQTFTSLPPNPLPGVTFYPVRGIATVNVGCATS